MKFSRAFCAFVLPVMLLAGPPVKKPQWVFDVKAPETVMEKQVTPAVKVKLQFEFGENSVDSRKEESKRPSPEVSWEDRPGVLWRYPLRRFSLWINGKLMFVPYTALAEEGDIWECEATVTHHRVDIKMKAGDAGGAHALSLAFVESKREEGQWILVERRWDSGEFEGDIWEKTIYFDDVWDDPNL